LFVPCSIRRLGRMSYPFREKLILSDIRRTRRQIRVRKRVLDFSVAPLAPIRGHVHAHWTGLGEHRVHGRVASRTEHHGEPG